MKKLSKKIIPAVFCLAVLLGASALGGMAEFDFSQAMPALSGLASLFGMKAEAAGSGYCGSNLDWSFDLRTGTLTISGTGQMYDYTNDPAPWDDSNSLYNNFLYTILRQQGLPCYTTVQIIQIDAGVEGISYGAFKNCHPHIVSVSEDNAVYYSLNNSIIDRNTKTLVYAGASEIPGDGAVEIIGEYAFANRDCYSISIPDGVTAIGMRAFYCCSYLQIISLPQSLETVGAEAFYRCDGLCKTEFRGTIADWCCISFSDYNIEHYINGQHWREYNPLCNPTFFTHSFYIDNQEVTEINESDIEGIEHIGDYAFYNCNLTGITVPDSVTDIGCAAFSGCKLLERVDFPGSVSENSILNIGDHAFSGCELVSEINFPNSLKTIGDYAFASFQYDSAPGGSSISGLSIPYGVTKIGEGAFSGCAALLYVEIPNSITSIGECAFSGCTGLENVDFENGLSIIGSGMFSRCTGLRSVEIPNSVTNIGNGAFSGCTGLTSIEIPNGVTSIGSDAFSGCSGLENLTMSNSVRTIGESAFCNCNSLTDIYYAGSAADWNAVIINYGNECLTSAKIHTTDGIIDNVLFSYTVENGKAIITGFIDNYSNDDNLVAAIPSSINGYTVTGIAENAFRDKTNLTAVFFPDSPNFTSIDDYAFSGCTSITDITIPQNIKNIGKGAFKNCSNLFSLTYNTINCSINYSNSIFNVSDNWLDGCPSLTEVTIGPDVAVIPDYFLYKYGNIRTINFSDNYSSLNIGSYAFSKTGIETLTIPYGTVTLGDYAFSGCTSLNETTIQSAGTIGKGVFKDCANLYKLTYKNPREGKCIGDGLCSSILWSQSASFWLKGCSNLQEVNIGQSVKCIPDYFITCCKNVRTIEIPESVTTIGKGAFANCKGLETLYYNAKECSGDGFDLNSNSLLPGKNWLSGCNNLENIVFGSEVTLIPDYAFKNRIGIKNIEIPVNVTYIGKSAFSGCTGLEIITLPDSVQALGDSAFSGCKNLASIEIPSSVTSIGSSAFSGCTGLIESLNIPDNTTEIGNNAFSDVADIIYHGNAAGSPWGARSVNGYVDGYLVYNNESKTELMACFPSASGTVIIPASVNRIADRAFLNCDKTTKIIIKFRDSEPEWGENVLQGCTSLEDVEYKPFGSGAPIQGDIIYGDNGTRLIFCNKDRSEPFTVPDKVTVIEDNAFYNCSQLESIALHDHLTKIGAHAFEGTSLYNEAVREDDGGLYIGSYLIDVNNSELTVFSVKSGTSVIATGAFDGCETLETVSIPDSVIGIGRDAFAGCENLNTVTVSGNNLLYVGENAFADTPFIEDNAYVGSALIKETDEIAEGTTCIADYAFAGSAELTGIALPASLKTIGSYAFADCVNLTNAEIPDGVTEIGSSAFINCGLEGTVTIPASVTVIGDYAFAGCKDITAFEVDEGSEKYSSEAGLLFARSDEQTLIQYPAAKDGNEYTVPGGTYKIANYAFSYADKLETVNIPDSTKYKTLAFKNCSAVRNTSRLKDGVELDGTELMQVTAEALDENGGFTVPDSAVMIAPGAFGPVKDQLKSIILNNVKIIGDSAFEGCENLTAAEGSENLLYIGKNAFAGCDKLEPVTLNNNVSFMPDSFSESTKISYTEEIRSISIRYEPEVVFAGDDITLTAEIKNGALLNGEKILWLDSDTGDELGSGSSITVKEAKRNMNAVALVTDNSGKGALESNELNIRVFNNGAEKIAVVDKNGKSASDIFTVIKEEPATFTLTLRNSGGKSPELSSALTAHWYIDGKEVPAKSKTTCEVKGKEKDFTVQLKFGYLDNKNKEHIFKETETYTVNVNAIDISDNAKVTFEKSASVSYRTKVTITATGENLPKGTVLAIYEKGGSKPLAKGSAKSVSYEAGEMKSAKTYEVKVIDSKGNAQKGLGGEIKIDVTGTGFFQRIIAFFKYLFSPVPTKTVGPKVK